MKITHLDRLVLTVIDIEATSDYYLWELRDQGILAIGFRNPANYVG